MVAKRQAIARICLFMSRDIHRWFVLDKATGESIFNYDKEDIKDSEDVARVIKYIEWCES